MVQLSVIKSQVHNIEKQKGKASRKKGRLTVIVVTRDSGRLVDGESGTLEDLGFRTLGKNKARFGPRPASATPMSPSTSKTPHWTPGGRSICPPTAG